MAQSKKKTLTPKQERFVQEYLVDLNATQAAKRAGYSEKTANEQGARLLANVSVHARIEAGKQKIAEKAGLSAEYVLTGLHEVVERSLQRKAVMVFDRREKKMVQETNEDGEGIWTFDSGGANRALELLGRHLGIFEKDNSQQGATIIYNVPAVDIPDNAGTSDKTKDG